MCVDCVLTKGWDVDWTATMSDLVRCGAKAEGDRMSYYDSAMDTPRSPTSGLRPAELVDSKRTFSPAGRPSHLSVDKRDLHDGADDPGGRGSARARRYVRNELPARPGTRPRRPAGRSAGAAYGPLRRLRRVDGPHGVDERLPRRIRRSRACLPVLRFGGETVTKHTPGPWKAAGRWIIAKETKEYLGETDRAKV